MKKKEPRKSGAQSVANVFGSMVGVIEPEKITKKSKEQEHKNSCESPKKDSEKKSRTIVHGGFEYQPANMMLRSDFQTQVKCYAAHHHLREYQVIDKALEEFFKSIKS